MRFSHHKFLCGLGYVKQGSLFIHGPLFENLTFGCPNFSLPEIEAACKMANILDDIRSFPEGFSTIVGKDGMELSHSQMLRLAIARVLTRNPEILVFGKWVGFPPLFTDFLPLLLFISPVKEYL